MLNILKKNLVTFLISIQKKHSFLLLVFYHNSFYRLALSIIEGIYKKINSSKGDKPSIGFVSPYKRQVRYFTELVKTNISTSYKDFLEINTVDAFQGKEKDLIIFSTVRSESNPASRRERDNLIGFLND